MAVLDLNKSFPPGKDGTQGPLPKQKQFLDALLDPNGPKFVAYMGGVGSGKSLILCIAMLTQAVMYGGTYVIAREFMPELRRTTMRQFLEVCPPELIIEHRVADAEIHIRSASGKPAIIIFTALEEPGKLRSLNLSGFGVDESSYISEEAFLLLQSRLRNPQGLRKGILVGNPMGHNWIYQYFVKKAIFKTLQDSAKYCLIVAPSTENVHLPEGYVEGMMASYSKDRIEREIMGSFDSFAGQIYTDFNRNIHVIKPFDIPKEWPKRIGLDHGFTNPAAGVWIATDYDNNVYIYREFYQKGWLIEEICKGNKKTREHGLIGMSKKEEIEGVWVDPSTKARRGQTGGSDWDIYLENIPKKWSLVPANNEVNAGIDRVKTLLKPNVKTNKPKLFIFETCKNLIEEITQYRWEELPEGARGSRNEMEKPHKYNDHLADALRYIVMSLPEGPDVKLLQQDWVSPSTVIQKELKQIRNPDAKDPFSDY